MYYGEDGDYVDYYNLVNYYYTKKDECKDECFDCKDCVDDPYQVSCNTLCKSKNKNCCESYQVFDPKVYGKAYIVNQPYGDLFNVNDAFAAGTIFKVLYNPYCAKKYIKGCAL